MTGSEMNRYPSGTKFVLKAQFQVNNSLHLRADALAGKYITELPAFFASDVLNSGDLSALLPDYPLAFSSLHLVLMSTFLGCMP